MNLHNVAMVAAITTRSKCYIKEMIKSKLLPNYVLLLLNKNKVLLPGQKNATSEKEIIDLLESANIQFGMLHNDNINSAEAIKTIMNRSEQVFIFSGYGGVILKEKTLATGKKFLHVHGGYLPDYRGSTTNYYSLIILRFYKEKILNIVSSYIKFSLFIKTLTIFLNP